MPERNTDEVNRIVGRVRDLAERYRAAHYADVERLGLPLTETRLIDHADNLEALCKTVDALTAAAIARPDERAVRERAAYTLTPEWCMAAWYAVNPGATTTLPPMPSLYLLDFARHVLQHAPIPTPVPPCPLSGGREVRVHPDQPGAFQWRAGSGLWSNAASLVILAHTNADLRTLADWLDSLPDAERGKA